MYLLIKPESIIVTIHNNNDVLITDFENLYRDHSQPHEGDAGLDLFNPEEIIIEPNACGVTIDLKIQCEAFVDESKEKNCWYYLMPRSSISKTPLRMSNSIGVIDAGYRGNIIAKVDNIKNEPYTIKAGTKLFQIVPAIVTPDNMSIKFELVNSLSQTTRGNQGFGSSS
jgi:dUTP pyrophosphatase